MDINRIIQNLKSYLSEGVDNYRFTNIDEIIHMISALGGAREYDEAIQLYQNKENDLKNSELYEAALTNIIKVCDEMGNKDLMIEYAKELKKTLPDHPYVLEISKNHTL
ncbi:hypothetical protein [Aquimarina sp. 2201CG5-10]|uniref:hypothetical protein n=1 Tax=Aquimarina callyspongiae TaxID=3098150 RepID=UPI002AB37DD5|nr:hypothetical protein [Aquimarina sp. 2201CG5-10]MDY8136911.1 hypothetical protein [Aquimarina sp. 2201CG5-10]